MEELSKLLKFAEEEYNEAEEELQNIQENVINFENDDGLEEIPYLEGIKFAYGNIIDEIKSLMKE